ncbi:MAG: LysM peptidoglycan-binding domain-containing protein [Anaerolineae bacterium]
MALVKLFIQVLHDGRIVPTPVEPGTKACYFNPEKYTLTKSNKFANQEIPGLSGPLVQFVSGGQRTLDLELLFDTWDTPTLAKEDVRKYTSQVVDLTRIDEKLHAPPILVVAWASLHFQCVLSHVTQNFTMFTEDGTPVRATLTVKFDEVIFPGEESRDVKRQTADFSKLHRVVEGETLSRIAGDLYEDPRQWRPIAIANGLADPREIQVGQLLRIPFLPFADPDTGEVVP